MRNIAMNRKSRHYIENEHIWRKIMRAYSGGERYIRSAIVKHITEIDMDFEERVRRGYYLNHPRKIARLITQYALATDPVREDANADLIEDFSRRGDRINEVMRKVSTLINLLGECWLYVGMPYYEGMADMERVTKERLRPFCQVLSPLDVVDCEIGRDGKLLWAITEERHHFKSSPFLDIKPCKVRMVWERDKWTQIVDGVITAEGVNPTGQVPLIHVYEVDGFGLKANHWMEDVVRISDALLNNSSEAQMNVVKQMFGLLVVSEGFVNSATADTKEDDNKSNKLSATIARSAAIMETSDEKGISRYIAPSGVENSVIREDCENLKRELYEVVGLAIQSTSNASQTAESKAWDFENVKQFLVTRADLLEQAEIKAWELMNAWDNSVNVPSVTYNRRFEVDDLKSILDGLAQIAGLPNISTEYFKQIARAGLEVMERISSISDENKELILAEINAMEPAQVPEY